MGNPLTPTSPFIDKNIITGCYCNNIYGENAILGCFHPIVPLSPTICLKIQFLTIYLHLHTPMGSPCHFFIFFMMGCVGWHIFLLISSEKLEIFSFLFIFFHYFCPFFRKNFFRPIYPHLTPPHVIFHFFLTGCVEWNIFLLISSEKLEIFTFFFHYFCSFLRKTTFWPIYPHLTPPMSFFHFFLTGCVGWNIVLLISSEKLGTFSFFFIFFSSFLLIFRNTTFWPIYPHLTPPHGPPHGSIMTNTYIHVACVHSGPFSNSVKHLSGIFIIYKWEGNFVLFPPFWG